jgi:hypothetical protein
MEVHPMQATTVLPANYRQQAAFDLSKNRKALLGAMASGIALLLVVGWLLVQLINLLRPTALEGLGLRDILTTTPEGSTSITIPFQLIVDGVIACALVMITHELVHGAFYWRYSGRRPIIGIKGPSLYAAAPTGVYFPRNQYLVVGLAPLVLLTLVGLLMMMVVPLAAVPIFMLFITFNAAGAAGDLLIVVWLLLSYSPDTLFQDAGTGTTVYGPEYQQDTVSSS